MAFADVGGLCFHPTARRVAGGFRELSVDEWILLGLLLCLLVLTGPVLALVALLNAASLRRRVEGLERELAALQSGAATGAASATAPAEDRADPAPEPAPRSAPPPPQAPRPQAPASAWDAPPAAAPPPLPPAAPPQAGSQSPPPRERPSSAPPRAPAAPGAVEIGIARIKHWFGSGNVPVKVGMLVLLVGVAALLRYASDQGWLNAPIELKLAGISAAALAALVFAWRQRASHRSFALALQGGAIGVLLLVAFAACKTYHLIGSGPAFAISAALIAGMAVLAVLQDSRTLAILGTLAGFMAPLWLSDGSGSHVALFTYYAALNVGIFAIAWVRPWRILNLLGFVFTWGIGTAWGVLQYAPDDFRTTEPFLLLFFAFYLLLPLLYARKATTPGGARIDGCLLFGTPLFAFALQAGLLEGARMPLALCALGLAALYALLAKALIRRERLQLLARGHAILAVGFATLAVPLALSAQATASVFALEGAGLVWLGLTQHRRLARWTGLGLQLAAACALWIDRSDGFASGAVAIANPAFMGALLIALAGFATAWLYRRASRTTPAVLAYLWGLLWWLGNGLDEITRFAAGDRRLHLILLLLGASGWLAAEMHRRAPARALAWTTLGGLLLAFPLAFAQTADLGQPFAGDGTWVWPLFAALGLRGLVCLRAGPGTIAGWAQLAWWLLWPTVLSLLAWHLGTRFTLADGWVGMLLALPWLALAAIALHRWHWLTHPLGAAFDRHRGHLQLLVFTALALWWWGALFDAADSAPLPWLPLLNPLELAQAALLVLLAQFLRQRPTPGPAALSQALSLASLVLISVMTLRGVHHWGGAPWTGALLPGALAQTSLALVWSLLGVIGWVAGSRRGQWGLWLSGAILMGVVLLKLLLVDRNNLGDLLGIGAFIAYGLLCTLVGWLAPAPPRRNAPQPALPLAQGPSA